MLNEFRMTWAAGSVRRRREVPTAGLNWRFYSFRLVGAVTPSLAGHTPEPKCPRAGHSSCFLTIEQALLSIRGLK